MLLRAKIRMDESDLAAFEARLFTDGTLQRASSSPTLAHDTSHASVSSCSSRSKNSSRSESQRHKPAFKQWVHYLGHLIAALWCSWSRLKGWEEHQYEETSVCALRCSGDPHRALSSSSARDVIEGEDWSWVWLVASLLHESMFLWPVNAKQAYRWQRSMNIAILRFSYWPF